MSVRRQTLTVPPGRRLALAAVAVVAAVAGLYVLLPALAGLEDTWDRLGRGDGWWLLAAVAL
ncbi:MAG TPA: hypothetical protein VFL56_01920, partial [Solirubrobacterales bacterium]|nr:hypothetical protein [Solirubrobacterales bacterium]